MTEEQLKRINELARKKKTKGLSPQETAEQQELYRLFLNDIRTQVTTQLEDAGYKKNMSN